MAGFHDVADELLGLMAEVFNPADEARTPVGGAVVPEFRPGENIPALDAFGECALAWVTAGSRWRTSSFPAVDPAVVCGGRRVGSFVVGVARCSVALDDGGQLPSQEQMAHEFGVQEDDKDRLELVACQARRRLVNRGVALNVGWDPVMVYGPEGGTVAVYVQITVELA